jgi:nicotinamide phosphoribosyltransferase
VQNNIVTLTDSYKFNHFNQYPKGTTGVYSYFEARKGAKFPETVFFGLQYLIKEYLEGVVVTQEGIEWGDKLALAHFGTPDMFNRGMWEHILNKHGGKLPVRIKAVPEGSVIPIDNVMMTIENLDPECYALTNHLETLLCHVWASSTCATLSREVKKMFKVYLDETGSDAGINFMLHDFGFRGVSSVEAAGIEGAGHLLNFMGTDTVKALETAVEYYVAPIDGLAYSVPATEHSVMTARGPAGEEKIVGELLRTYPTGILSIVADSYDVYNFAMNILGRRYNEAINRRDGKVVCRPDSGNPTEVVPKLLEILGREFGYTMNAKKFKVLNPKIGLLWGDGIDMNGIEDVLNVMKLNRWAAENIVFGMGGGLLQKIDRDMQRFAFKSSAQQRGGEWFDIFKDPIEGGKSSKRGRLKLLKHGDVYETVPESAEGTDVLQTVFENGELVREYTFAEARANAKL